MNFSSLISTHNLTLAWRRITTARNLQYKRFFRDLYSGYELGLSKNISLLHGKLKGSWSPVPPTRLYLAKASGLLRPITLLAIEDQIVFQAIADKVVIHVDSPF